MSRDFMKQQVELQKVNDELRERIVELERKLDSMNAKHTELIQFIRQNLGKEDAR